MADLGQGVMDNAMVEAAAYVMERRRPKRRSLSSEQSLKMTREAVVDACVAATRSRGERRLLVARQRTFQNF